MPNGYGFGNLIHVTGDMDESSATDRGASIEQQMAEKYGTDDEIRQEYGADPIEYEQPQAEPVEPQNQQPKSIEQLMEEKYGTDQQIYEEYNPVSDDDIRASDYAKSAAGSTVHTLGSFAQGLGIPTAAALNAFGDAVGVDIDLVAENPLQGLTDYIYGSKSEAALNAQERSQIQGDITEPSSIGLNEDFSGEGLALNLTEGVAQIIPQIGAAVLSGGMSVLAQFGIGAGLGVLQGVAGGANEAHDHIMSLDDDELYAEAGYYRNLIDQGMEPAQAKYATAERAASGGAAGMGFTTGFTQGLENVIVAALTKGKLRLPAKTSLGKWISGAASGFVTEAAQETAEGVAGRLGSNLAVEGDQDLTEGSAAEAIMGGLVGGTVGGPLGGFSKTKKPKETLSRLDRIKADQQRSQDLEGSIQEVKPASNAEPVLPTVEPRPSPIGPQNEVLQEKQNQVQKAQQTRAEQVLVEAEPEIDQVNPQEALRRGPVGKQEVLQEQAQTEQMPSPIGPYDERLQESRVRSEQNKQTAELTRNTTAEKLAFPITETGKEIRVSGELYQLNKILKNTDVPRGIQSPKGYVSYAKKYADTIKKEIENVQSTINTERGNDIDQEPGVIGTRPVAGADSGVSEQQQSLKPEPSSDRTGGDVGNVSSHR